MTINLGNKTRARIIDGVLGQLSDGKWENSPAMDKYWKYADTQGTDLIINNDKWDSGFVGRTEEWIRHWFAGKLKAVVQDEVGNNKQGWSRDNMEISEYISYNHDMTVSHCYECYEYLLGRTGHKYAFQAPANAPGMKEYKAVISKSIETACGNFDIDTTVSTFDDWENSLLDFFEGEFEHFKDTNNTNYINDITNNIIEKNELVWPKFTASAQIMKNMLYNNSDLLKETTDSYGLSMAPDDCFKAMYYKAIRPLILMDIVSNIN